MKRLVTFLGKGNYKVARYRYAHGDAPRVRQTRYVATALAEFLEPDEICFVGTEEARQQHFAQVEQELKTVCPDARVRFTEIADLSEPREFWEYYDRLAELFLSEADDFHVCFDITHSFRTHAFFAASLVSLVGRVPRGPRTLRIFYGKIPTDEREEPVPGELVELTEVMTAFEWVLDIATFIRTGFVGRLADRAKEIGRVLRREWARRGRQGSPPEIREFGEALDLFASDLVALRLGSLLQGERASAKRLASFISRVTREAPPELAPLKLILPQLEQMVAPLCGGNLYGKESRDTLAALASTYHRLHRYLEAAAVLREATVLTNLPPDSGAPGTPQFPREWVRQLGVSLHHRPIYVSSDGGTKRLSVDLGDLRNDLLHGGLRDNPRKAQDIHGELAKTVELFRKAPLWGKFANISNHPSERWSDEQRGAALAIASEIYDIPFPHVSPQATLADLERLADDVAAKVTQDTRYAMVMGEFTLTTQIVARLQAAGVVCVAACTERIVQEDGDQKITSFRFRGFRPYPRLFGTGANNVD